MHRPHAVRRVLIVLAISVALDLTSCGPPQLPTGPAAITTPSGGGGGKYQCTNVTGKTDPWLVEWDATQKARFQATSQGKVLLVKYSGCDLEVLYGCEQQGEYKLVPTTPSASTEYITNEGDIFAKLPVGALSLAAEFQQGDKWSLNYVIVGMRQSPESSIKREELSAACSGATHYVSAMAVGAYQLISESRRRAAGGATLYGAGAGVSSGASAGTLREDGVYDKCRNGEIAADDARCQAIVQLFLEPIIGAAPPPSVAGDLKGSADPHAPLASTAVPIPPTTANDEVQQPDTNLYWLRCPIGQAWNGSGCVGDVRSVAWSEGKELCPAAYRLPTRQELMDLLGRCEKGSTGGSHLRCQPCGESAPCTAALDTDGGSYWSSTQDGSRVWYAGLSLGTVSTCDPTEHQGVRCVRSVKATASAQAGSEVRQTGTNLYWLRCPLGQTWNGSACTGKEQTMDWQWASGYCPEGYRLPNRQELVGLLADCDDDVVNGKYGYCKTCSESGPCNKTFPSESGGYYWTSSANDVTNAWTVNLSLGRVLGAKTKSYSSVRCVRTRK